MTISKKIKAINNKIELNKAKISALSSENVKDLNIFCYAKELKNQTSVTDKHYQKFGDAFRYNKKEEKIFKKMC